MAPGQGRAARFRLTRPEFRFCHLPFARGPAGHVTSPRCYFLTWTLGKMIPAPPSSEESSKIRGLNICAPKTMQAPSRERPQLPCSLLYAELRPQSKHSINIWWITK